MQYAIPVVAIAALVVSALAVLGLVAATALFAGTLAIARAEDTGERVSRRA